MQNVMQDNRRKPPRKKVTVRGKVVKSDPKFLILRSSTGEQTVHITDDTSFRGMPIKYLRDEVAVTGHDEQGQIIAEVVNYPAGSQVDKVFGAGSAPLIRLLNTTITKKLKIRGIVLRRDSDTFVMRDANGRDITVRPNDYTDVSTKGGSFLFSSNNKDYSQTAITRGLNLEVVGLPNSSGQLVANKIKFSESDLRLAQTLAARVDPVENRAGVVENRIGSVEENAQRLSGQLDELGAISNAAKGGAKAAQDTADAAVAGVNAANERISALDNYVEQGSSEINFRVNSAELTSEGKAQLDLLAGKLASLKGYVIEVSSFAETSGSAEAKRRVNQRRADAVIRYLVENHNIPLRRIITPYVYGEAKSVADNSTRAGRALNRHVRVKIFVNEGLTQPAPSPSSSPLKTPTDPSP
jgi:outer membrane protein OmpA-like peptidoglycan-associated protein